jgi:hypothetical protein
MKRRKPRKNPPARPDWYVIAFYRSREPWSVRGWKLLDPYPTFPGKTPRAEVASATKKLLGVGTVREKKDLHAWIHRGEPSVSYVVKLGMTLPGK